MGITLCLMIGPVFFQMIQISIERGYRHALYFASGVWASDLLLIAMSILGVSYISILLHNKLFVQYENAIVGALFIFFGIAGLLKQHANRKNTKPIIFKSDFSLFISGFAVNSINPFSLVFWLSLSANFNYAQEDSLFKAICFFGTILCITVGTDIGKAKLAQLIINMLKEKHLKWLQIITGITLIIFGIAIIARI